MRRPISSVIAVSVAAVLLATAPPAFAGAPAHADAQPRTAAAATSWIVSLESGFDLESSAADLSTLAGGTAGRVFTHVLNGFVFHGSARAAEALARDPRVRTIVEDAAVKIVADTQPPGIKRIRAEHPTQPDAHDAGFTGAGVRIAIIDTGIDLDHPDLVANIEAGLGRNCYSGGPPQDGHGHGTHVAGTAAAPSNGLGVVGVAPSARLVPVKVLSDTGTGDWSNVICGIDYLTGLATDGDPSNDVRVANMSLGDVGTLGTCSDGGLRQAICQSVAAGITYVAAAGNSASDAATFVPAAYPEVIAVSAIADFDGEAGGAAGCHLDFASFTFNCDDQLASFSNFGSVVDVAAPGVSVYSTWTGGGYQAISGTSMASPHVAGVAALVRAANPTLSPAQVKSLIEDSGENPDGSLAEGGCGTASQWGGDPDGIGEPLVNALRAASMASDPTSGVPTAAITSPSAGSSVSGLVSISATATDPDGIASVEFLADGVTVGTDTTEPYASSWDSTATFDGSHSIGIRASDTGGHARCVEIPVTVGTNSQGSWVGTYGVDGYVLGAWNGTSGDLAALPAGASLSLEQGSRATWVAPTSDVRALQNPTATERRATTLTDNTQLRVRLSFSNAYSGTLHLYAVDWDSTTRRETVSVNDGTTTTTINITTSFNGGAWMHVPVSVGAGGSVLVTVTRVAGVNAVLSGLFLGGAAPAVTVPGAPTGLTATAGNAQVALSWAAPSSDGGSPVTGYKLYRGTAAGAETFTGITVTGTSHTDTGLTNGTTYFYKVSAVNGVGEGSLSAEASATPVAPLTAPGAPQSLLATAGDAQVALNWAAPTSNGGAAITGYKIYRGTVPGGETFTGITVAGTSHTDTGLTNGTTYFYKVSAVNVVGEGSLSAEASATPTAPVATVPGAPTGLTATPGNGQVSLSWTAPASNGGSAISGYRIYRATVAGAESYTGITVTGTSYTNTGLTNGTTYYYKVSAENDVGEGSLSAEASATPATAPSSPLSLTAMQHKAKGVVLTWAAPTSSGGFAIMGYRIYRSTASGSEVFFVAVGSVLTYRDTSTTKGVRYYYTVTAVNAIGESPPSLEANAVAK